MNKIKNFKMIMDKSGSNRVIMFTNHYQIIGEVYDCDACNKEECVNLVKASICNIEDSYDGLCDYESKYDWLHINLEKVVAYSFI